MFLELTALQVLSALFLGKSPLFLFDSKWIMNALELKGSLTDLIASVKDEHLPSELLKVVRTTISNQKSSEPDWWDGLSKEEQMELDRVLQASLDETNWVDDKSARTQIQQWLDK